MTTDTINIPRTASFEHGFSHTVASLRARLRLALNRRAAYRRCFNELSACTDRNLRDMGIPRSDIPRIAREAADMVTVQ